MTASLGIMLYLTVRYEKTTSYVFDMPLIVRKDAKL